MEKRKKNFSEEKDNEKNANHIMGVMKTHLSKS